MNLIFLVIKKEKQQHFVLLLFYFVLYVLIVLEHLKSSDNQCFTINKKRFNTIKKEK